MQSRNGFRRIAYIAPPIMILGLASLLACADSARVIAPHTQEPASPLFDVVLQGSVFLDGKPVRIPPFAVRDSAHTLPVARSPNAENSPSFDKGAGRKSHQYFRDDSGHVHSVATVYDDAGAPKRVYSFRDGKIQFAANPTYERRGSKWVRTALRITYFDDQGNAAALISSSTGGTAPLPAVESTAHADATALIGGNALAHYTEDGRTCGAEDGDYCGPVEDSYDPCEREKRDFITKSSAASALLIAYAEAMFSCLRLGDADACGRIPSLSAALLTAGKAGYDAWEAWQKCKGAGPSRDAIDAEPSYDSFRKAVEEFVAAAERSGTFWCNPDGDYCIYWS
jgi:hypothetical protein